MKINFFVRLFLTGGFKILFRGLKMTKKTSTLITTVVGGLLTILSAVAVYFNPAIGGIVATVSAGVETALGTVCDALVKEL